jgi:hypothetical protein
MARKKTTPAPAGAREEGAIVPKPAKASAKSKSVKDRITERASELAGVAREAKAVQIQLSIFPTWADDRRGAPNEVIRSAIFGVVKRGPRKVVANLPVAGPADTSITITGWRLDQYDLDIYLEIMHLARDTTPGTELRFSLHTILKRLHDTRHVGSTDKAWIMQRLKNLAETTISFDEGRRAGTAGALITSFAVDKETGEGVITTNPKLRSLWDDITHLNIEQRRMLGGHQLAKAMHAMLSSHATWYPMRLDTLMHRVGCDFERVRAFREQVQHVLEDFLRREWIYSYKIGTGDGGLVEIDKVRPPTQVRSVQRLQTGSDDAGTSALKG